MFVLRTKRRCKIRRKARDCFSFASNSLKFAEKCVVVFWSFHRWNFCTKRTAVGFRSFEGHLSQNDRSSGLLGLDCPWGAAVRWLSSAARCWAESCCRAVFADRIRQSSSRLARWLARPSLLHLACEMLSLATPVCPKQIYILFYCRQVNVSQVEISLRSLIWFN